MPTPAVSVALVTYNHEKYIAEAIQSVLDQTFPDFELVVVDDGSTDRTPEVIASFRDPRVVSIRQPNGGPSAATNRALAACRGEYVALLSGDDACEPHRLQTQLDEYMWSGPGVLFSGCSLMDDDGRPLTGGDFTAGMFDTTPQTRAQILWRFFFQNNFINGVSAFSNRRLFRDLGPYDPTMYQLQDYDMWIRFVKKYSISFLPEPLIRYRVRGDGGNLSAPSARACIRDGNERYLIMRRFFDGCPDSLFREAFAAHLRRPDLVSPLATACEQAFLYLDSPRPVLRYIGMERFQDLYRDTAAADLLAREFRLPLTTFVKRLTDIDPFGRGHDFTSSVYVDTGAGYSEAAVVTEPVVFGPRLWQRFDLAQFGRVKEVRWDPVEGRLCRVALERAAWRDADGREHVINLSRIRANGRPTGLGAFEFDTIDPMVFLPVSGSAHKLMLDGTWTVDDQNTSLSRTYARLLEAEAALTAAEPRAADADTRRPEVAAAVARSAARGLASLVERLRLAWRPLKSGGVFSS